MKNSVYLDYAAATPIAKEVLKAMLPYLSDEFYNPSALYMKARDVHHKIDEARASVARDIGARPSEIIFTAGGTEANNLAINGVMSARPDKSLLISAVEHEAVRLPAGQFDHRFISVSKHGDIDTNTLSSLIDDNTLLVSVMMANNEVGTIQPIKDVVGLISDIRRERLSRNVELPIYVHTDACQATSHLDINVARLGVDLMTLNGGKIYGPKQSGVLYVRAGTKLNPIILGGGQEQGMRSGTENVPAIVGFAAALSLARRKASAEKKRLDSMRDKFIASLEKVLPEVVIHGHPKHHLPHNLS